MKTCAYQRRLIKTADGFILVPFLIVAVLSLALLAYALRESASTIRTIGADRVRSDRYYEAEASIRMVVDWVRLNSQALVSPFKSDTFYTKFDRTAPGYGANDTQTSRYPTKLKLKGSQDSAILTNSAQLATAAFPATTNIISGANFDALGQFSGTNFGSVLVRLTLVDAIPLDPTKDAPPLETPQTDFYPVWRVDAYTQADRGAHVQGYITGNLYYIDTIGFYGRDYVEVDQNCVSAAFTGANPGPTNAKCPVGSNGQITIANNAKIYGSARSNGTIAPVNKVCADYPACTQQGKTCQGASCNVPNLPTFKTWDQYCPTNQGDYTVAANQNKILITPGCYGTVTINNRGSLTLQTTTSPYYFQTLIISGGNAQTQLKIAPVPNTGTVQLYVLNVSGDNLNGNQTVNPAYKPSQFRIFYLGTSNNFKINGNAPVGFAFVAPYADVEVQGSSNFNGGIMAKSLKLTGSATIVYDESLGGTSLQDLTLRLRNMSQVYN